MKLMNILKKILIGLTLIIAPLVAPAQNLGPITNDIPSALNFLLPEGNRALLLGGLTEIARGFGNGNQTTNYVNSTTSTNYVIDFSSGFKDGTLVITNAPQVYFFATNPIVGKSFRLSVSATLTNATFQWATGSLRLIGTNITALASNKFALLDFYCPDLNYSNVLVRVGGQAN